MEFTFGLLALGAGLPGGEGLTGPEVPPAAAWPLGAGLCWGAGWLPPFWGLLGAGKPLVDAKVASVELEKKIYA